MRAHIAITLSVVTLLVSCKKPGPPDTVELGKEIEAPTEAPAEKPAQPPPEEPEAAPGDSMQLTPPPEGEDIPAPPDVAAPPADADKTESGLASKVLKPGTGTAHPSATSEVTVNYSGWTTDGKMFDSSVKKGKTATFPLDKVIPGWTEGLQLMVEGEIRRLWIPEELAYKGRPDRPQGMLVFDVQLIEIVN